MSSFENNIKEWVSLDNKLKAKHDELRVLREKKSEITNIIHNYANKNNLSNAIIQISDGRLKFGEIQTSQSLTFKFLEECLNDIISNKEQIESIITYIKNKREIKTTKDIKRFYVDN